MRKGVIAYLGIFAAGAALAGQVIVGGQGSAVNYPYCGSWDNAFRGQALVLKTDAVPAGEITKWEWYASQTQTPGNFNKFTLKLCHTSLTTLTDTYNTNYGGKTPVQVYYRETCRIAATPFQWFGFDFDKGFAYNGTDNLVFEVWWVGDDNGNAYTFWTPNTGRYVYSYIKGSTPYYGYPDKGQVVNYLHYMRITLTGAAAADPSSFGRVKAIYR